MLNHLASSFVQFQIVMSQIELPDEFVYYFALYLVRQDEVVNSAGKFDELHVLLYCISLT